MIQPCERIRLELIANRSGKVKLDSLRMALLWAAYNDSVVEFAIQLRSVVLAGGADALCGRVTM